MITKQKRNESIKAMRERGLKLKGIAWEAGLSLSQVRRILKPKPAPQAPATPKSAEVISE